MEKAGKVTLILVMGCVALCCVALAKIASNRVQQNQS